MIYEWDEAKRAANLRKHGLDFLDAYTVLESEYVMTPDSRRGGEARQQAFAYVFDVLAVLAVAYLPVENRRRIISFRPAKRNERSASHAWLENHFNEQR